MVVKVDDESYNVSVCTEHEDEASPKAVKQKVGQKAEEIEDLKKKAAKLGLTLQDQAAPTPAAPAPAISPKDASGPKRFHPGLKPQTIQRAEPQEEVGEIQEDIGSGEIQEDGGGEIQEDISGNAGGANMERHESYATADEGVQVKTVAKDNQVITARSGRPITVPKKIHDNEGGTTNIRINNSATDASLQTRFKSIAEASKGDRAHQFSKGYTVRDCPACTGSGRARTNPKVTCPKCGGDGFARG
jgi:hypothetical protein